MSEVIRKQLIKVEFLLLNQTKCPDLNCFLSVDLSLFFLILSIFHLFCLTLRKNLMIFLNPFVSVDLFIKQTASGIKDIKSMTFFLKKKFQ